MSTVRGSFGQRPLVTGSILGVRTWHVAEPDRPTLTGVVHPYKWLPGVNEARCIFANGLIRRILEGDRFPDHDLLGLECTCGFYAYFDERHALAYSHTYAGNVGVPSSVHTEHGTGDEWEARDATGTCDVVGVIEGFGRVVVGDKGFRAEKTRVLALARPDRPLGISSNRNYHAEGRTIRTDGAFDALTANYPAAAVFSTLDAMLGEFPLTTPDELDAAVGS